MREDKSYWDYENYVCPVCFKRLEDCTCEFHPWHLINIDKAMQEPVRILNDKGYKTQYCCEGHKPQDSAYIAFPLGYMPKTMPKGFRHKNMPDGIYYKYKNGTSASEFAKEKNRMLSALLEWCDDLKPFCVSNNAAQFATGNVLQLAVE